MPEQHLGTRRAVLFTEDRPLQLTSGETLGPVEVAYATYGRLTPERDNAIFVAHALTGDALADTWWSTMVGPGRPVDTEKYYVVCANLLGGCQGTTGPSSTNPRTGEAYGLDFPHISVGDLVTVHRALLDHLGIERLHAAIGGSLGGMQVLQWASDAPGQVERAILVAASARLSAQNIAFSAIARQAILRDPQFHKGQYAALGVRPENGLSVARMLGHITYVSDKVLEQKFGRDRVEDEAVPTHDIDFQVESYLDHQARTFVERFDALSYLYLARTLDYFDPFADPGFVERISPSTRFLLVSFDSDWRFPTAHSEFIEENLTAVDLSVERHEIHSDLGHDSFLLEPPGYHDVVRRFLEVKELETI